MVPKKAFLTKGAGKHKEKLSSFEMALRSARVAEYNIVSVSSIFPPGCTVISIEEGLKSLSPGEIVYSVMSTNSTNEPNRLIAASVGLAVPGDRTKYGYLSEHHSFGENESKAGDYAEDLAASMLATVLGVEFDPDASWDEKKEIWKISEGIVRTRNVTQSAIGDKRGLWTTVLACVVFVP